MSSGPFHPYRPPRARPHRMRADALAKRPSATLVWLASLPLVIAVLSSGVSAVLPEALRPAIRSALMLASVSLAPVALVHDVWYRKALRRFRATELFVGLAAIAALYPLVTAEIAGLPYLTFHPDGRVTGVCSFMRGVLFESWLDACFLAAASLLVGATLVPRRRLPVLTILGAEPAPVCPPSECDDPFAGSVVPPR